MNHTYRLIWNALLQAWVAVAECTRARGKSGGLLRLAAPALAAALLPGPARALDAGTLPGGGQIVVGSGSLVRSGNTLTIRQGSDKLIAHWQNFDIGSGARVDFQQPGATAVALNRVLGNDASQIFGSLTANGRVFLVNPNGVLFGKSAQVDVGGLVASTLDIKDGDFLKGHYAFGGPGDRAGSRISNEGRLHARDGGAIALLGGRVSNSGVIEARLGSVALAAGDQVTLDFAGDGLLNVKVPKSALAALVESHGTLRADGGSVLLTADAGEALVQTVVNNTGLIEARSLENHSGKIVLLGGMAGGVTQVAGKLDASAPGGAHSGDGGFIETSGAHVNIAAGTVVTTQARHGRSGTWLIDPNDFTVAAKGGNMTGAAVSTALQNNGNFVIQTATMGTAGNGDIFVNDAVSWSSNSTLTLQAERSVKVNAPITATGSGAGLTVLYNDGAGITDGNFYVNSTVSLPLTGSLSINGQSYTLIDSLARLGDLSGRYALVKGIAANVASPQGDLSGTVEGLGHTISGIAISSNASYVGLFGNIVGTVRNLGVEGSVNGHGSTSAYGAGLLAGRSNGSIINTWARGSVSSNYHMAGGLVGVANGTILNAWADVTVTSTQVMAGGLIGILGNGSTLSRSHATGAVSAGSYAGGLIGRQEPTAHISHSYASGAVTSTYGDAGGLVGFSFGNISHAYATGKASATNNAAGGLIGDLYYIGSTIDNVWASGAVSGYNNYAGGLVGTVSNGKPTINQGYWDAGTTGQTYATADGNYYNGSNVGPLSTANAFQQNQYAGFDFTNDWYMGNASGTFRPMLRSEWSAGVGNPHQLQLMAMTPGAHYTLLRDINATATGTAATTPAGMWDAAGFVPVGDTLTPFSGYLDGGSHVVSGLTINRGNQNNMGLIGVAQNATLTNIGLAGGSVSGFDDVGALVGFASGSTISAVYGTGSVTSAGTRVGGLAGYNINGNISNAYVSGNVTGDDSVGGLVGYNANSNISNSYVTGNVTGSSNLGGLVGSKVGSGSINTSFYATTDAGGSTINGSSNGEGTALTLGQLQQASRYSGWSLSSDGGGTATVWRIYDGHTTPLLRSFLTPLAITPDYDGSGSPLTNIGGANINGILSAPHIYGAGSVTQGDTLTLRSTQAGQYTATSNTVVSGLYSDQQGYDITTTRTISTPGSAAGDLHLPSNITWSSGRLLIDTGGTVTTGTSGVNTTAISGSVFRLANGTWRQNAPTLSGFAVNDFQLAGGTFLRATGGDGSSATPYLLTDAYGLQGMASASLRSAHFALVDNIGAGGTAQWNGGAGFVPVGTNTAAFTGSLDGRKHTVSNLTISREWEDNVGLFGYVQNASLRDIGLINAAVTGKIYVGALVGWAGGTSIRNSFVADGQVTAESANVGGLAGVAINGSLIDGSYASANVEAKSNNGSSNSLAGGLVGISNATISNSYATGNVTGSAAIVISRNRVGGLVGVQTGGTISNSYATGTVSGNNTLGGLIGFHQGGTMAGSFHATTDASGNTINSGAAFNVLGTGKPLADLRKAATFASWDLSPNGGENTVWRIYEGDSTPLLRSFLTALTVTAASGSKAYDGTTQGLGVSYSTPPATGRLLGTATTVMGGKNAGMQSVSASGLYSTQRGYDIHYATGSIDVKKAVLTVSNTSAASKTYDGTTAANISVGSLTGLVGNERIEVTASGEFDAKDAGNRSATARYTLADGANGGLAANYTLADTTGHQATITPKALAISGTTAADKTYDGTTAASITIGSLTGLVGNERIEVTASGEFDAKDAGSRNATARYTLADGANGGLATNYRLADTTGHQATIRPRQVAADPAPHPGEDSYSGTLPGVHTQEGSRPAMPASGPEPYAIIGSGIRLPEGH